MTQRMGDLLCPGTPSAGVREEHVDVILCEEALVDRTFGDWLAHRMEIKGACVVDAVSSFWSGKPASESDVVLLFEDADRRRTLVHVENKITTRLSDEQVDGYVRRIREHADLIGAHSFRIAIVAPQGYLDWQLRCARFDHLISYEDIADRMDGEDTRRRLRAGVLRAGVERYERLGIPKHTEDWVSKRQQNLRRFRFETRHPLEVADLPKFG